MNYWNEFGNLPLKLRQILLRLYTLSDNKIFIELEIDTTNLQSIIRRLINILSRSWNNSFKLKLINSTPNLCTSYLQTPV